LLEDGFEREPNYDLPAYWQNHLAKFGGSFSDYQFVLRVHPDRVRFLQWIVPGRYELDAPSSEDGWMTARFQLESIEMAKMLIFGLGAAHTEIVEPAALRDAMVTTAREFCAGA
jgi:hypothetical protein